MEINKETYTTFADQFQELCKRAHEIAKELDSNGVLFSPDGYYTPSADYIVITEFDGDNVGGSATEYGRYGGPSEDYSFSFPSSLLWETDLPGKINEMVIQRNNRLAELKQKEQKEREETKRFNETQERKQYEELKKKYG